MIVTEFLSMCLNAQGVFIACTIATAAALHALRPIETYVIAVPRHWYCHAGEPFVDADVATAVGRRWPQWRENYGGLLTLSLSLLERSFNATACNVVIPN